MFTPCKRASSTRSCGPTPMLRSISFTLNISTTNTAPQVGLLLNRFEMPDSEIVSMSASEPQRYDNDDDEVYPLTVAELNRPGFVGNRLPVESIWIDRRGHTVAETHKTFTNRKGYFTVREVVKIVESFEKLDRPKTNWFGGIDCHHIFFEGLRLNKARDAFVINWGS